MIGKVISINGTPNVGEFWFVVKEDARKDDFVSVKTDEGTLLGRIDDIVSTNDYFSVPETLKEFSPQDFFPTDEWEVSIAKVIPLMVFPNKSRPLKPVKPGADVEFASSDMIKSFYSFDDNGLHLGSIRDIDVKINLTKLFQKHLAILAMSGAGKSYLTSVIIEELLKRPKEKSLSIILADVHGEYVQFDEDIKFRDRVSVFRSSDIKIAARDLSSDWPVFKPLTTNQKLKLDRILGELREEKKSFSLDDVISEVESLPEKTRDSILGILYNLRGMKLFDKIDNPTTDKLCRQGHLSILDFSDTISQKKRQLILFYFGHLLFSKRIRGDVPPFVFIVEEAHNFAPQNVEIEKSISRGIIEKIAREGRKFGASLCMISQRPVHLSTTALSQCGTKIILRVTNPYDIDNIKKSSEGLDSSVLGRLPSLSVGEAIVVGEATGYPLVFNVRKKEVMDSKRSFDLEKLAEEYALKKKKYEDDLNAFM